MALVNEHYLKLKAGYLFPEIGRRVRSFTEANPQAKVIRLGIGDVTCPLPPSIIKAFQDAVEEMATEKSFMGYGPEQGYEFLINTIIEKSYQPLGVELKTSEVFISDGSKCDCANILDIFALENVVAIGDPVYPVYNDTNVMIGRTGEANEQGYYKGLVYLPCTEANGFNPAFPDQEVDIIYLCFPNNPTGAVATREQLKGWVDYALQHNAVIFFDAAYEAFITDPTIPHSIYEIEGAKKCAIEFRSFSKTAGFTGVRCALTVVPEELTAHTAAGEPIPLNRALEPSPVDEVQWCLLPGSEGSSRGVLRRRMAPGKGDHRLLHGKCPDHPHRSCRSRPHRLWRRQRSLYLAQDPRGHDLLGLFRQAPDRMQRGRHPRQRVRAER